MFGNCQMGGQDLGFPDVCLTPAAPSPVPIPYPNMAAGPMAVGFVPNILLMAAPAHNLGTTIPMTNGDNAGVATGVASGMVMGPSRHTVGAFTCLLGGMPATRLTSMTIQNSTNVPGARIAPSQTKVLILSP
jgi:hypothetical protein